MAKSKLLGNVISLSPQLYKGIVVRPFVAMWPGVAYRDYYSYKSLSSVTICNLR